MTKYLKLIWFAEDPWTKYHAAIGINAQETLCGIYRSTRAILPSEKLKTQSIHEQKREYKCLKCLAVLKKRYGSEHVVKVKVKP